MERGASAAVERLGRLLSLVPYLLARPGARVSDVARTFGVSEDQLVRDLQLVWMCGLPGYLPCDLIDVNIEGGEIDLSNADTIARPLRLGVDEALALLVGLRALAEIPGLHDRDALRRTIAKLERAAGDAAALSGHVAIEFETKESVLTAVRVGLDRGRRLHLDYYVPVRDERTERTVDPMRVVFADGRSYLEAWCHRAEGVRLFRLDRVLAVTILDEPAHVPREAAPLDLDAGLFRPSPDDLLVTLEVAPPGRWVAEYYPYESAEEIDGGGLRLRLRTPDPAWARRLALRLGPSGRVVDPPALVESIREAATRALAAYDQPR
ncbi:MAG: helix-turn-helix transcriptional regulator [Streptomycetales bacterium]